MLDRPFVTSSKWVWQACVARLPQSLPREPPKAFSGTLAVKGAGFEVKPSHRCWIYFSLEVVGLGLESTRQGRS